MKKLILCCCLLSAFLSGIAQEDEDDTRGKFNINNMYIGGGVLLGGGNRGFAFGIQPEIGYSITRWLDAGVSINLNYQTQRIEDFNTGAVFAKLRSFNYGGGVLLRAWIKQTFHLTIQPEYNWIKATQIDVNTNQKFSRTFQAESILVGVGYGNHDVGRQLSYLTLMIDLAQNINSPYRDQFNRARPVVRTGIGFYLGRRR